MFIPPTKKVTQVFGRRQGQRSAPVAILSKFRKDERKLSNYFMLDDNIMFFVQYFI
jgi:hypothetical protein